MGKEVFHDWIDIKCQHFVIPLEIWSKSFLASRAVVHINYVNSMQRFEKRALSWIHIFLTTKLNLYLSNSHIKTIFVCLKCYIQTWIVVLFEEWYCSVKILQYSKILRVCSTRWIAVVVVFIIHINAIFLITYLFQTFRFVAKIL